MRYDQLSPVPPLTKITKWLIITCSVLFVLDRIVFDKILLVQYPELLGGLDLKGIFGLVPSTVLEKYWIWQFVTYVFLHGHEFHLLFNMIVLWYFGAEMEMRLGEWRYLRFFLYCGIGAGIFNFLINISFFGSAPSAPIIGASGAIYGILAAYGIFYADRYFLIFFLFPLKARYFVLIIAAVELLSGIQGSVQDNVAHFAHLGGMGVGAAYTWFYFVRPRGGSSSGTRRDREREQLKKKFTLIVNEGSEGAPEKDDGPNYWN